jgi:hypothetical protein
MIAIVTPAIQGMTRCRIASPPRACFLGLHYRAGQKA